MTNLLATKLLLLISSTLMLLQGCAGIPDYDDQTYKRVLNDARKHAEKICARQTTTFARTIERSLGVDAGLTDEEKKQTVVLKMASKSVRVPVAKVSEVNSLIISADLIEETQCIEAKSCEYALGSPSALSLRERYGQENPDCSSKARNWDESKAKMMTFIDSQLNKPTE